MRSGASVANKPLTKGSLHDGFGGFDGFGGSREHLALLPLVLQKQGQRRIRDGFDGFGYPSTLNSTPPFSASPKPHPSKPRPCNMPQAKTEVALQFSECCAAETALQHRLFCSAGVIWTKSCTAANKKLHCNIEKAALQESGAFLPLSCGFQAPTFRHPRLGQADILGGRKTAQEKKQKCSLDFAYFLSFQWEEVQKVPRNFVPGNFFFLF